MTIYPPGADRPLTADGTAQVRFNPGGRFVEQVFQTAGDFPGEGRVILGYGNARGKYTSTNFSTASTSVIYYEGDFDAEGKASPCGAHLTCSAPASP